MLEIFTRHDNQWWGAASCADPCTIHKTDKREDKKDVSSLTLAMLGELDPRSDLTATVDLVQVVRYNVARVAGASQSRITKAREARGREKRPERSDGISPTDAHPPSITPNGGH